MVRRALMLHEQGGSTRALPRPPTHIARETAPTTAADGERDADAARSGPFLARLLARATTRRME